jgi:hypothetical protein
MGQSNIKQSIKWGGRRWWLNGGYYCNRRGQLLHRAIYAAAHGPIPEGVEIHHKDGNKTNNDLSNLEALSGTDHRRRHCTGFKRWGFEDRSQAKLRQWANREPYLAICAQCGKEFSTTGTRSKYCSGNCRSAHYRETARFSNSAVCEFCGKDFKTSKYQDHRFCSRSCATSSANNKRAYQRRRGSKVCPICGATFRKEDPRTQTCSRKCGYILASRSKRTSS